MNTHEKLDTILRYMTKSASEIPLRPETIAEKAHVNIGRTKMYLILDLLNDDGYVQDTHKDLSYVIKYKGVVFIENGGYTLQHKVFKRKKTVTVTDSHGNSCRCETRGW